MDYRSSPSSLSIPPCPVPPSESTFEEEKKNHFKPQDLANAMIHDNAFLSCCLGADRYGAAASTPFSLIVLGPPYDGKDMRGGSHDQSSLAHWFSSSPAMSGGNQNRPFLQSLWKTASYRVCCDGAYDMVLKSAGDASIKPDLLIGHLDELTDQTKAEIERERNDKTKITTAEAESTAPATKKSPKEWNQVEIARENSDEWTDLQKALWKMKEQREKPASNAYLHHTIVCYYDGPIARLDKLLSHINALYQFHSVFPRILLLTDSSSITELLSPGHHILLPNKELEGVYASCGIFPIGSQCRKIYATGLHWPLHGDTLAFGGLVSSCNAIVSDRVLIENTDPVIFHTNLMTMNTPLQRIRSLVTKEGIGQRSQSSPSASAREIQSSMGASFGSTTAPKAEGGAGSMTGGDIGGRTQSLTESNMAPAEKIGGPIINNNNNTNQPVDESMLHYERGYAQQEPLVPNPSMATAPAGSYGHE